MEAHLYQRATPWEDMEVETEGGGRGGDGGEGALMVEVCQGR